MTFLIAAADTTANDPHHVDRYVGHRVRLQRRTQGLSQSVLANKVGVTFQQIQKYERGMNRISASKLYEIGHALDAPIAFFFAGLPESGAEQDAGYTPLQQTVETMMACPEGAEVAMTFPLVRSVAVRRAVVRLLRSLASEPTE